MNIFSNRPIESLESLITKYFKFQNETSALEPLSEIFEATKKEGFSHLLNILTENEDLKNNFAHYLKNIFRGRRMVLALTEANILSENSFFAEFKKRVIAKVLPAVEDEDTVSFVIEKILLSSKQNFDFLLNLSEEEKNTFLQIMGFESLFAQESVQKDLFLSINILAWRAIGNALDVEVVKMAPEYKNFDNPFIALQNEIDCLLELFQEDPKVQISAKNEHYKQAKVYLSQCLEFIKIAFKNTSKYGLSSKTNQSLMKIRQQLVRISEILPLLVTEEKTTHLEQSKTLVENILRYKSHRNNFSELFADSTLQLSHLITTHTAQAGTHYIAFNYKQYMDMFKKAAGGGIIVGFLCVLKMLYSYSNGSEFTHAFLYSFNYAMGFVLIYLLHYTLATKQPAMTAATMAKVLSEDKNTSKNYTDFADLVSKLFRTQFIAFVGNVLLAFPVALLIIYGLDIIFQQNLAIDKANKLLRDLNPVESKAILHASIAGVFLFISGIISGNISNNSRFYQIPQRIIKNPYLNKVFGAKAARSISAFYSKNWAGVVSNFWFGVFLGATAPIGNFLGLDLDIRHITFAAGNLALAIYGKGFDIDMGTFWISFITVFLIGFFNFIVSFGLSMSLAFRSRKVKFGEVGLIYREIFNTFVKNPAKFFIPLPSGVNTNAEKMVVELEKEGKN
ncbi:recombinase [Riemerella anatipestifer]|uniref:recombinase n=1 Tax=Riemerella anatipestifer TaxID=34085 RepID=UPI0030C07325